MTPVINERSSLPKPRVLLRSSSILGFYVNPSNGDVYAETNSSIVVTSRSGSVLHRFKLPAKSLSGARLTLGNSNNSLVVDPSGDIEFFMQQGGDGSDLVSLNASGVQEKDILLRGVTPNGLFAWHDSSGNWAAGVVVRGQRGELIGASGRRARGREPVPGVGIDEFITPGAAGGLIYTDGNYVHILGPTGSPVSDSSHGVPEFGSSGSGDSIAAQTPGGAFSFAEMGGAVEVGSTIYVADAGPSDAHGIEMFTTTGIYEGTALASSVGTLAGGPGGGGSPLFYDSATHSLVFANGDGVAALTLHSIGDLVRAPAAATQDGFGDTLGVGAGLRTSATGGYFPSGSSPAVLASFDDWWAAYPGSLELTYSVADSSQVARHAWPRPKAVPLRIRHPRLRFDLSLPPATPGTYLVNAKLVDTSRRATVGATCLTYSVGMAGDLLDLSKLAVGPNSQAGPSPERGVELAAELGTDDMREQVSLANLLPRCTASAPTESSCGPGALTDWASVDPQTEQGATKATSLDVSFEVQIGQDDPINEAVVSSGYWGPDVAAIVEHFHRSAPDLRYVEAWNEPNTGPYSPAGYVDEILQPFYQAVQAANGADKTNLEIIGGTVVGMDVSGWWTGIAHAGGFRYMNIAGIHPYPGYDRSFEEEGFPAAIEKLRALMDRYGAGSMPIWVTEQGWWSDGEEAFYDVGNWAAREWMWLRSFGISNWNYFITEGQFSGYPTDFSLIDESAGDYFVKPGAIGLMTASNLLGARPFIEQVPVDIPHAYGMLFGPPSDASSGNDVLAVWTDDLVVPALVSLSSGSRTVTIPTTGALGQPGSLALRPGAPAHLELSGAPVYLSVAKGDAITVGATKPFGMDFASASKGATAQASSSASPENRPSDVISGDGTARNGGDISTTPAWIASTHDRAPVITVRWRSPQVVDRVIVATSSIASVLPGLRDYWVELYQRGRWSTVATVANEYFDRMKLVSFSKVPDTTGIRVLVRATDYLDLAGGLPPFFWNSPRGQPAIYSIEVYGG